jgi:hypothetical protein
LLRLAEAALATAAGVRVERVPPAGGDGDTAADADADTALLHLCRLYGVDAPTLRRYLGAQTTFLSAWERTGRIVSISVVVRRAGAPGRRRHGPQAMGSLFHRRLHSNVWRKRSDVLGRC